MCIQWQKIFFWLIAEITLNLLGLDDLADYSEFIFEQHAITLKPHILELNLILPPSCPWIFGIHIA